MTKRQLINLTIGLKHMIEGTKLTQIEKDVIGDKIHDIQTYIYQIHQINKITEQMIKIDEDPFYEIPAGGDTSQDLNN